MGFIARVLEYLPDGSGRSDRADGPWTRVDPSDGPSVTPQHVGPSGDDSPPLEGDLVAVLDLIQTGQGAVVGYLNHTVDRASEPGEIRRYSRDEDGALAAEVRLRRDGTIELTNGSGWVEISPDGTVEMANDQGEVKLDRNGALEARVVRALIEDEAGGSIELENGTATINGATITPGGDVITAAGVSLDNHMHTYDRDTVGPNLPAPTTVPLP